MTCTHTRQGSVRISTTRTHHPLTRSFKQAADPPLFSASFFVSPSPTAVKGSGYGTSTKQRKMGWRVTGWVVRMMSYSSVLFSRRKCSWRALLSVVLPCVCGSMCVWECVHVCMCVCLCVCLCVCVQSKLKGGESTVM